MNKPKEDLIIKKKKKKRTVTEVYFSQFWRLRSSRSRCQSGRFHSEAFSLHLETAAIWLCAYTTSFCMTFFFCIHQKERKQGLSGVVSHMDTNPIRSGLSNLTTPFNLDYFLGGSICKYSHMVGERVRASIYGFGEWG